MFRLSTTPLEQLNLKDDFKSAKAGAFSCFEGWVRNHNGGKEVVALEYEAAQDLCKIEAGKILLEAKKNFGVIDARCYHRTGKLSIGEMAVWVGVIAPHRDEAFKACRYIIDEVKHRLPIWKKEYYKNGESGWVNCNECSENLALKNTKDV